MIVLECFQDENGVWVWFVEAWNIDLSNSHHLAPKSDTSKAKLAVSIHGQEKS
jgi:hypothetical protein